MSNQPPSYGSPGNQGEPYPQYGNQSEPYPQYNAMGGPPPMPAGQPMYGSAAVRPAELGERFLAKLIDWVILFVLNMIVVFVLLIGVIVGTGSGFAASLVSSLVATAIVWGYFTLMETNQGATVGKMALKLKVVGASGGKPTFDEAWRRNVWCGLSLIGIIPIIGAMIGGLAELVAVIMIAVGISQDTVARQAWHDKFAGGTRVVKSGP